MKNDILLNMNKQHVTLLVLSDLSAIHRISDTVDRRVLLSRLTQNLVYLERHLNGFVPTLMEDLSVLWSKEIYFRV